MSKKLQLCGRPTCVKLQRTQRWTRSQSPFLRVWKMWWKMHQCAQRRPNPVNSIGWTLPVWTWNQSVETHSEEEIWFVRTRVIVAELPQLIVITTEHPLTSFFASCWKGLTWHVQLTAQPNGNTAEGELDWIFRSKHFLRITLFYTNGFHPSKAWLHSLCSQKFDIVYRNKFSFFLHICIVPTSKPHAQHILQRT